MLRHNDKPKSQQIHTHWIYSKFPYLLKYSYEIRKSKNLLLKIKPLFIHLTTLPIAITLRFLGFETLNVNYIRIGHLCADIDAYLKVKMLFPDGFKPALFCNPSDFPNSYFTNLLKDKIKIIKVPLKNSYIFCRTLNSNPISLSDVSCFMEKEPQYIKNLYSITGTLPLFFINSDENNMGQAILASKLNKKIDKWVCIHYRNSSYTANHQKGLESPNDDFGQDFRNTNPNYLVPVVKRLNKLGIHVFLMGHEVDFPMQNNEFFTNFSKSSWKTDFLDVYLSAKCLFYFGNSSGSAQISRMFGIPTIGSNLSLVHCFNGTSTDITAPKKYFNTSLGRYLTLSEVLNSPIRDARNADDYTINDIILHENSPEELILMLNEMLVKLDLIESSHNNLDYSFLDKYNKILKNNNIILSEKNSNISLNYLSHNQDFIA